jgi:hypothetical protein
MGADPVFDLLAGLGVHHAGLECFFGVHRCRPKNMAERNVVPGSGLQGRSGNARTATAKVMMIVFGKHGAVVLS